MEGTDEAVVTPLRTKAVFQRRHYIAVAEIIAGLSIRDRDTVIRSFSRSFAEDNPAFNSLLFDAACRKTHPTFLERRGS